MDENVLVSVDIRVKVCPFCGKPPHIRQWSDKARVECSNSYCAVQPVQKLQPSIAQAVRVWNVRRKPSLSTPPRQSGSV